MLLALFAAGAFVATRGGDSATTASAATPQPTPTATSAVGPPGASSGPTTAPTPIAVTIDGSGFHPATIRVYVGQLVAWTNADKKPHAATAADGSWDTGQIDPTQSQALQFFQTGKWDYLDGFNPFQHATLIVLPGPAPAGAQ